MHGHELEIVLLALLAGAGALVVLSLFTEVPYPILLVLGGLALSFAPIPDVELDPDLVFLIFLPPLLYSAAFFTSVRDLRANLRPIGLLAVGLVLATMLGVAVVAHLAVPGLSWPAAFVLGAIVSPTDPVAATAIARRVGAPRQVVTVVEGEALINDGTALVLYKLAVGAAVSGSFSLVGGGVDFVAGVAGGVGIGLAVGWLVAELRARIDDPLTEIAVSLITAYFAYVPAELLGVSGVIAAVTTGVLLGWRSPGLQSPATRLQAFGFWEVVQFLLNAALFILIGLQLPVVAGDLEQPAGRLVRDAAVVCAAVVAIRGLWVIASALVPRLALRRRGAAGTAPDWASTLLVGWAGMRGAVTLAAALALPLETDTGEPFPQRALVVFLAFAVVVVTLVLEGLTLPRVIRALGAGSREADDGPELEARVRAAEAAIGRLDELAGEPWVREDSLERLRGLYAHRRDRFASRLAGHAGAHELEERTDAYRRLRLEVLDAEREVVLAMRTRGDITEEVMRVVEHDLDLEQRRLET